jgi:selenide,water dikinase
VSGLRGLSPPELLVGVEGADDAGVYKLTDELALIQTVDFLTPVVDDPYRFGQIAAANSLSDVYAMGGRPICAMNLVAFPVKELSLDVLRRVLDGGLDKMKEAGVALVGGHSVEDKELKYGLSVSGIVDPSRLLRNTGLGEGDGLVLTKPLGTGILATAVKAEMAGQDAIEAMSESMAKLNRAAAEVMAEEAVSACTDVTGFGLIGHAAEMLQSSALGMVIYSSRIPLLPEVERCAEMGLLPGGLHRNRCAFEKDVLVEPGVPSFLIDAIFDPQTSGGLLIGLEMSRAEKLAERLGREGIEASVVARVIAEPRNLIQVV